MESAADARAVRSSPSERHPGTSAPGGSSLNAPIYLAIALSMLGLLGADLYTPLGVTVWVGYLIPIVLSLGLWRPQMPLLIALASTLLIVATFVTDEPGVGRHIAQLNRGFGVFTIWVVAIVGWLFISNRLAVWHQQWLQSGRTGLYAAMSGEQPPEQLGERVLSYLADFLGAHAGAMFIKDEDSFRRMATYAVPADAALPGAFALGDGMLGQAAKDGRTLIVNDVPEGYLRIGSSLGQAVPLSLIIAPIAVDKNINAVLELGFLHSVSNPIEELLDSVSESIGIAVRSANYRTHLQNLLEETQRQAEGIAGSKRRAARRQRRTGGAKSRFTGIAKPLGATASGSGANQFPA
jgi:hypothetical protein